ncbi:DUF5788 family protein [Methanosarcina mazei]|jgi:hypothetical protein|nr:DUF5788 family protein [Methanosarcina mazei]AKB60089.1 hypothetical protein MSMAP_0104 [Methanosarcina mazei SarPi]MDO5840474.1 DUF5788 family protein [Methanosarcina mazei]QIB89712.1 hypothetical protein FQU78_00480 [Methanosarcina mazei]UWJ21464.1 hypothetical protein MSMAT_0207 [Methanosarcina mazei TMA]BBL66235.1 hypothetical protein MmazTMA_32120 [Methanosarcina mazei]
MKDGNNINEKETEYLSYQERNKLLWSLRSDFAWAGKKIPEIVEIDNEEYMLRDMIEELGEIDLLSPDEIAEIRALIPKLQEKAKVNEELLETEELTVAEAEALCEEATGILRAAMDLKDRLEGKIGEKGASEFKRMLNTQKLVDEKRWQELIKSLK